jgi:Na+-transporting NADH:ubiquinone oxidoreductase subunit NqrF
MQIIILGVLMFTGVIVSLVVLLTIARSKLVSGGEVKITINDDPDKALTVKAGDTLLKHPFGQQDFHPFGLRRQGQAAGSAR